jgi:hypothetical protein
MGFGVQVMRIDLQLAAAKANGAFTEEDRAMLTQIFQRIAK